MYFLIPFPKMGKDGSLPENVRLDEYTIQLYQEEYQEKKEDFVQRYTKDIDAFAGLFDVWNIRLISKMHKKKTAEELQRYVAEIPVYTLPMFSFSPEMREGRVCLSWSAYAGYLPMPIALDLQEREQGRLVVTDAICQSHQRSAQAFFSSDFFLQHLQNTDHQPK